MPKGSDQTDGPQAADARLRELLAANACIVYHTDLPDPEYPAIKCSVYGAPKTNELFVKLTNGEITFVDVVPSPLDFPVMADRIFGMDVVDHAAAFALADRLWEENRSALTNGQTRRRT